MLAGALLQIYRRICEKILKISQHLPELWTNVWWHSFFDSLCSSSTVVEGWIHCIKCCISQITLTKPPSFVMKPSFDATWSTTNTHLFCKMHSMPSCCMPCLKETVQNCFFCHNFVKFPPILIIFGRMIAKRLKLCEVHSFSTSSNLRHHTTVLNADVPNCYKTLKVVSIRLLTFASSVRQRAPRDLSMSVALNILWNFVLVIVVYRRN